MIDLTCKYATGKSDEKKQHATWFLNVVYFKCSTSVLVIGKIPFSI